MKLTGEELGQARNLWDLMNIPARMFMSLQTPDSVMESWNAYMQELGQKYGFDPRKTTINLQTGEINA